MLACSRCGWQGREARMTGTGASSGSQRRRSSKIDDQATDVVTPPADIDLAELDRALDKGANQ